MNFEDLGLSESVLRAVTECGYASPTPIQEQAVPIILMGRDLVGLAQTGTGKTAGFTLPMIEILSGGRARARMPRSLILSPTRELAAQIAENFDLYGKYSKLTKALLVGGSSMEEQVRLLDRGVDVLIATPGRLIDLFERGRILLSDIKIFVIDEADRMMDMGFIPDVERIASLLPPIRQTLLFSATMPPEIKKLTQKFQSNPKEVSVAPQSSTAERVEQFVVQTTGPKKRQALDAIIRGENIKNAFVFCNRKREVDQLARWLRERDYAARPMHGDLEQKIRTQTLQDFKDGVVKILVCSDVAARGLDVDDVSHVFNFDVPFNAEDYVHRIGRTGRAGKSGRAWMLATPDEDKSLAAIERLIRKPVPVAKLPGGRSEAPERRPEQRDEHRGDSPRAPKSERRPERQPESRPVQRLPEGRPAEALPEEVDAGGTGFGNDVPGFFGIRK